MADPIALVTTKSDAERAKEHKDALVDALGRVATVLDRLKDDGFEGQFQLTPDWRGKHVIGNIAIVKRF